MATLYKPMDVQVDGDGISMAGAKLYFYQTGTSTPQDTYSQSDLDPSHVNPNPVLADGDGLWPPIYMGSTDYKAILKTADDVTVQTIDPVLVNPQATSLSLQLDAAFGSTQFSLLQRGASVWQAVTLKAVLDNKFGTTQGQILYRGAADWAVLAPPAASALSDLRIAGAAANPTWTRRAYLYATIAAGVVTILKSAGLSIARTGNGKFTGTINPVMPDAFYRIAATSSATLSGGAGQGEWVSEDTAAGARTTSTFFLEVRGDNIGVQDPDAISIEVFG